MRTALKIVDSISEWTGRGFARWLSLALILVVSYDVIMRYVFTAPTMWAYETCILIGGTLYILGWAYVQRHDSHIRIDIFYSRLSPRKKAIIDVIGSFLFLFPVLIVLIFASTEWAWKAWEINEKSTLTYWYPPLAPFRTAIMIGVYLFAFQSVAKFIRDSYMLLRSRPP